jgi:hypothetical protein
MRHWLRRQRRWSPPTYAVAMRRSRTLRHWRLRRQRRPYPRNTVAMSLHRRSWRRHQLTNTVAMRRPHMLRCWQNRRRPTNARLRWYAGASNLPIAVDAATVLACPVGWTRLFPPRGGGLHHGFWPYRHCWRGNRQRLDLLLAWRTRLAPHPLLARRRRLPCSP